MDNNEIYPDDNNKKVLMRILVIFSKKIYKRIVLCTKNK